MADDAARTQSRSTLLGTPLTTGGGTPVRARHRATGSVSPPWRRGLAVTAIGSLAVLGSVPAANSAPTDDSEAAAQLIEVDALALDALDAVRTESGNLSAPGPNRANIDAEVLEGLIDLEIGDIGLPLIGDGTNDGLLDLGDAAAAGVLNGYAESPDETSSIAASGA